MNILVTGGAGFIGAALSHRLLDRGDRVLIVDNLNDYYEVSLKKARLNRLEAHKGYGFKNADISNREEMERLFKEYSFDCVVNLAAQAGVRYSIENPAAYIDANLVGFGNILEGCRHSKVDHLVYASSSSVYGGNKKIPFSERDVVDHPVSLYAATKKSNELMAYCYAHLYDIACTGLRFFTVYGPWGRPDMAFFKFTKMILAGEEIPVFNHGELTRDFTFIDDIVEGVLRVIDSPPSRERQGIAHSLYNIGNGDRVSLMDYIHTLEQALGVPAKYNMLPMQPGDVEQTNADITALSEQFDFRPNTSISDGLKAFVRWYREYYNVE